MFLNIKVQLSFIRYDKLPHGSINLYTCHWFAGFSRRRTKFSADASVTFNSEYGYSVPDGPCPYISMEDMGMIALVIIV